MNLDNSPTKYFSFWDTICFNIFICNGKKRSFVQRASKLISLKLSVEYILGFITDFELLKRNVLTNEEYVEFGNLSYLNLDDQMKGIEL